MLLDETSVDLSGDFAGILVRSLSSSRSSIELLRRQRGSPVDYRPDEGYATIELVNDQDATWGAAVFYDSHSERSNEWLAGRTGATGSAVADQHVLANVAASLCCDALVTLDSWLLAARDAPAIRGANIVTPSEAAGLIGLYLRSRGDFTVYLDGPVRVGCTTNFFVHAARQLLPSEYRWRVACRKSAAGGGDDRLPDLADTTCSRSASALRARDELLYRWHQPDRLDLMDATMFYLDVFLIMLNAAFDAASRTVHLVYQPGASPKDLRNADWLRASWRTSLTSDYEPLFGEDQPTVARLRLLSRLRNTIHAETWTGATVRGTAGKHDRRLVGLPRVGLQDDLLECFEAVAPVATLGLEAWGDDSALLDPGVFIDAFAPSVFESLDSLIGATDIARLPDVVASAIPDRPPANGYHFTPPFNNAVKLLTGL